MIYGFNAGEVFEIAIEIEENGRLFYEKAQAKADDEEVKKVFASLGAAEVEHKQRFADLKSQLPEPSTKSEVWDPDNETDQYLKMMADMHVFREGQGVEAELDKISSAEEALKLAIQFEKDSIIFFLSMQDFTKDEQSRGLIGQLVKEEQEHLKLLTRQLKNLIWN